MWNRRSRTLSALTALLLVFAAATAQAAQVSTTQPGTTQPVAPAGPNYSGALFVQVTLGNPNQDHGIRLLEDQPDGLTQPLSDTTGRQALPNATGSDRFFYFDIHDSYIHGGKNQVTLTITYKDLGLTPVYMEYDSFDRFRPDASTAEVTRKRIPLVERTNTEGWRTIFVTLEDARFGNNQPGGADFRIGAVDDLIIRNVSARLVRHEAPIPPPRIVLDGQPLLFNPDDAQPYIDPKTDRTLLPVRAVVNALGIANDDIKWDNDTRTVELKKGQTIILLTIDSEVAQVNGIPYLLQQPAVIQASRTYVPLRFVMDQFGLDVHWDPSGVITLTSRTPQPGPPTTP